MPRFRAFPGLRYAHDDLALVTAPPYDVIDADQRAALAARHERNVVHVDLPVDYADAAERLAAWQRDGDLVVDAPSLYLYRMTAGGESTLGVIGALGLEPPGTGDVLPHEHTTPKAKSDRLDLLRATNANLSAVWGLSLSNGLSKHLDVEAALALGRWDDEDGVRHELWHVTDDDTIAAIVDAVESAPVVIADGHHRFETCLAFEAERTDLDGAHETLCYVVELAPDQLTVKPIHRLLHIDVDALMSALESEFELDADGGLAVVTAGGTRVMKRRNDDDIDSVALDRALTGVAHEVRYQHGVDNVERAVQRGEADAAVLLRPVTVDDITRYANAREKMPPKSTFFWPKPRTGTVFRSLTS